MSISDISQNSSKPYSRIDDHHQCTVCSRRTNIRCHFSVLKDAKVYACLAQTEDCSWTITTRISSNEHFSVFTTNLTGYLPLQNDNIQVQHEIMRLMEQIAVQEKRSSNVGIAYGISTVDNPQQWTPTVFHTIPNVLPINPYSPATNATYSSSIDVLANSMKNMKSSFSCRRPKCAVSPMHPYFNVSPTELQKVVGHLPTREQCLDPSYVENVRRMLEEARRPRVYQPLPSPPTPNNF